MKHAKQYSGKAKESKDAMTEEKMESMKRKNGKKTANKKCYQGDGREKNVTIRKKSVNSKLVGTLSPVNHNGLH